MFAAELQEVESLCRKETQEYFAEGSAELTEAANLFDPLVQQLYRFACCFWGCHGQAHIFENLGGRFVSHLVAAYGLVERGYYDEAASLVRSVGEIANLINLFWAEPNSIHDWLNLKEKDRRERFAPPAVRNKLRNLGHLVPFNDAHYKRLCELVVHPIPKTRPNAYHDPIRPVLGAYFQAKGLETVFFEICWSLTLVAGPLSQIASFPRPEAEHMASQAASLFELIAHKFPE